MAMARVSWMARASSVQRFGGTIQDQPSTSPSPNVPMVMGPRSGAKVSSATWPCRISRPRKIDPYATVIELRLDGPPVVEEAALTLTPEADGRFTLRVSYATRQRTPNDVVPGGGDQVWIEAAAAF